MNRSSSTPRPSLVSRIRKALGRKDRSNPQAAAAVAGSASTCPVAVADAQSDLNVADDSDDAQQNHMDNDPRSLDPATATATPQASRDPAPRLESGSHRERPTRSQPVPCMAFARSPHPTPRSPMPRPSSAPASHGVFLLPRLTAMGPKTPTSIIERERFLQPADRRNLDLSPYYNPLALVAPFSSGRARRARTPDASGSWFDELASDEHVPLPPRYGDRRQSRRMRPDEMRVLEEQLERVLVEDRLGRPPAYQRRRVYV